MTRSTQIRDAIASRIEATSWFELVQKTQTPTVQPDDLPMVQVYVMAETLTPDGDDNVGAPYFVAEPVIGVSIIRGFDDPDYLEGQIDADADRIEALLLRDPSFVGFPPAADLFESIVRITRRRLYPKEGETYFAEMRIEFTFRYRVGFEPIISDDYLGATVKAWPVGKQPPGGFNDPTPAVRPAVFTIENE